MTMLYHFIEISFLEAHAFFKTQWIHIKKKNWMENKLRDKCHVEGKGRYGLLLYFIFLSQQLKMAKILNILLKDMRKSRCFHSNGRKWRGTEEPLDEGERGEWKSWLETEH